MFTNHSVRRTAATRMAENGATIIEIQVAGGWKSEKVAKSYINKSMKMKVYCCLLLVGLFINIIMIL